MFAIYRSICQNNSALSDDGDASPLNRLFAAKGQKMKVDSHSRGFELTDDPRKHAELRQSFALDWAPVKGPKVILRLSDTRRIT
jgi:hypothetical protein